VPEQDLSQLIDLPALERFVNEHVAGTPGRISVEKHVAGYSNETFYVSRGGQEWVMRRPPRGPLLPTAHDVAREYRFIDALYGRARVPAPVALCEDPSVIGAPFYLMSRVRGVVPRDAVPAAYDDAAGREAITREMVEALVELHAVDWRVAGIKGHDGGYLERQLGRWSGQWDLTRPRTRNLPGLDRITAWLRQHLPESPSATIVHGDYKLDNVMFDANEPKLIAIFDWEMATVGDPLADVGYLMNQWMPLPPPPAYAARVSTISRVATAESFPPVERIAEIYEERSGRSMRNVLFYRVLAQYKLIVILEGLYMHFIEGSASNPGAAEFEWRVPMMVESTQMLIDSEGTNG
jgi:aminoglycoside phosphotransferase (APT) family kinase protein